MWYVSGNDRHPPPETPVAFLFWTCWSHKKWPNKFGEQNHHQSGLCVGLTIWSVEDLSDHLLAQSQGHDTIHRLEEGTTSSFCAILPVSQYTGASQYRRLHFASVFSLSPPSPQQTHRHTHTHTHPHTHTHTLTHTQNVFAQTKKPQADIQPLPPPLLNKNRVQHCHQIILLKENNASENQYLGEW